MKKSHLWAAAVFATIFAIIGIYLAGIFDLPYPFTLNTTRLVYAVLGVLLSILFFSRFTSWVVKTTARLAMLAVETLALEISKQFTTHNPFTSSDMNSESISPEGLAKLKQQLSGGTILDTSSLIDGRLVDVAKSGFLSGLLLIPDFVLRELQQVADSGDSIKRARGRRGFEIINDLKKIKHIKLEVWDKKPLDKFSKTKQDIAVDDRLVNLAKTLNSKLLTCDYNLNQVAKLRGVTVLNINDLINALKVLPIPGETLQVKVAHPGKEKDQMVGYLADGTMVIAKGMVKKPDSEIEVKINKVIQGSAGRILFGRVAD
ncbi:MAG: PIN/TRAM domain-containing protein [Candidatus Daviesbacteria bacterium]|nr:PIN/TRAM domain-containing protein [Candidatus Daviesbacteria bacterium]